MRDDIDDTEYKNYNSDHKDITNNLDVIDDNDDTECEDYKDNTHTNEDRKVNNSNIEMFEGEINLTLYDCKVTPANDG